MASTETSEQTPRFPFGRNWRRFLTHLDEPRVQAAEAWLRDMLGLDSLEGLSFLDIGSGSGFELGKLVTVNTIGNNDFVFVRERAAVSDGASG